MNRATDAWKHGAGLDGRGLRIGIGSALARRPAAGRCASTKGRWPGQAKDGATVNATVAERDSDLGGAVFHDNREQVERIAPSP